MLICFDLDQTITSAPEFYRALMGALTAAGVEVHVLSGVHHKHATQADAQEKKGLLSSMGMEQGTHYSQLTAVSGPEKKVAKGKVNYMTHAGATSLVDNSKRNVKAARKAGFLALHHLDAK